MTDKGFWTFFDQMELLDSSGMGFVFGKRLGEEIPPRMDDFGGPHIYPTPNSTS